MQAVLETPRLILRAPVIEDLAAYTAFCADPDVMRHIGGIRSREGAFELFRASAASRKRNGFDVFTVINKATGEWMGRAGPTYPAGWPGKEVAWGLNVRWWGAGYATEAASACIDHAFDILGWDEVIHTIAPDNTASQRLARRLGSVNRGPVDVPGCIVDLWSQGRDDWRANRLRLDVAAASF